MEVSDIPKVPPLLAAALVSLARFGEIFQTMAMNHYSSYSRVTLPVFFIFLVWICSFPSPSLAYRPGELVPISRSGQYHGVSCQIYD
jgi:hypothetical protein